MFKQICLIISTILAFVQAGVFELQHNQAATSFSSSTQNLAPISHGALIPQNLPRPFKPAHDREAQVAPAPQYVQYAHPVVPVVKSLVKQEVYVDSDPHYVFEYAVKDTHTGDIKSQKEERNGYVVKGVYSLLQPDGVTRTVHYSVDEHSGFNAQVEYSGQVVQKPVVPAKAVLVPV